MQEDPIPNEASAPTQSQPCADENWRRSRPILSLYREIEKGTLRRIAVQKTVEEELEEWDTAEKKPTKANQRVEFIEYVVWWDKKSTHVLIDNEKKKALDIMEEAQTTMEDAH